MALLALAVTGAAAILIPFGCRAHRGSSGLDDLAGIELGSRIETGVASWYGHPFHGRLTASGEVYDMHLLTAAHRTLPFGTVLRVVNLDNQRTVEVRVTDRGPFVKGRILDLSRAAAEAVNMIGPGTARVDLILLSPPPPDDHIYRVQAGAFRSRFKADRLQGRIQDEFPDLDIRVRGDGDWHRVQIGNFERRTDAYRLVQRLARSGYEAWVVSVQPDS